MKTKNDDITTKLEITVQKTIDAIARIQRFVMKYGSELNNNQKERIINKVNELQKHL
ncbi:MAG TPA: hypothetical protein PK257_03615 [Candidatus Woesebacteria bacterium]|nr:hypothetical protein [Candidatus Woesebacteria bacterium]